MTSGQHEIPDPEQLNRSSQLLNSAEHLARLVFLSYRFSQGGIGIQSRFLLHIRDEYHPEMFNEPLIYSVRETTRKLVTAFFMNQTVHPPLPYTWEGISTESGDRSRENAISDVDGVFERVLGKTDDEEYAHDIECLTRGIVAMDLSYLQRVNGRADVNDNLKIEGYSYPKDPFESQFVSYGILRKPTRTFEYDSIFSQVGDIEIINRLDDQTLYEMQQVLKIYLREHEQVEFPVRMIDLAHMLDVKVPII